MSLPYASTKTETGCDLPNTTSMLHGGWLVLAQAVWGFLVVLALSLFFLAISVRYLQLSTPPENVRVGLAQLGLSVHFYALYYIALSLVFAVGCFVVAALIAWRKSDDGMGLFVSLLLVLLGALNGPNSAVLEQLHPALAFSARFLFFLLIACLILFFFIFPDGQFVPRWTRSLVLIWMAWLLFEGLFPGDALAEGPGVLGALMLISGFGTGVAAQIYRYIRVSNPVQRQQVKWVVLGATGTAVGFLGLIVLSDVFFPSLAQPSPRTLLLDMAVEAAAILAHLLIPLSIGFAILRYRLWDIDIIINRALVYGVLTASIVGLYMLVVGGLGALLHARGNLLISLLGAGLVATLFAPLRDRLQRGVNRLMYGERDDPYSVLSRLGQRLEATLAPDAMLSTIVETVREALKLPYVAIMLKQRDEFKTVAEAGRSTEQLVTLPLIYQSEITGHLLLAPRAPDEMFTPADQRLLQNIAHQAGVALQAVRLQTHAVRLASDLQHSRERLVTAREEERRRLRNDLHDGLGPQLASLTLKLETTRNRLGHDPVADGLLTDIIARTQTAVADIRRLVYALRPPALDELGLVSALRQAVAQYSCDGNNGVQITLEAPEQLPPLPAAVEVAAYRIAQEALANVVRHAGAHRCDVRITLDKMAGSLRLEIEDNGRGLPADPRAGVGLHSMHERAEELGGICAIEPIPGSGTRVLAQLPLGLANDE
jgi:signal transduction histidine kinase